MSPHTELYHLSLFAVIRLAIGDMDAVVAIISMERPILMPSVHLAYAAVLTRCVDVQMTVIVLQVKCATLVTTSALNVSQINIVLQIKCATQLTTSATLVLCH